MPRKARIDAPGALHHVIIRGIEKKAIFRDNRDKHKFLARIGRVILDTSTKCYGWALLTNHVHFSSGADGSSQSLADAHPRANALGSVGNADMLIILPPMDRVIGGLQILERLAGGQPDSLSKDGEITAELQVTLGATNELGFEALSCKEL
jgi:hypothetical protein